MKKILISIKPEWVAEILKGKKTIEVRKTAPKCELPVEVYIYCTKNKLHYSAGALVFNKDDCFKRSVDGTYEYGDGVELMGYSPDYPYDENNFLNGKVVAKFTLRRVEKFDFISEIKYEGNPPKYNEEIRKHNRICKEACISPAEVVRYLDTKCLGSDNPSGMIGYAWHIDDLEIFDKPKKLDEFGFKKAPQSWCYVEVEE